MTEQSLTLQNCRVQIARTGVTVTISITQSAGGGGSWPLWCSFVLSPADATTLGRALDPSLERDVEWADEEARRLRKRVELQLGEMATLRTALADAKERVRYLEDQARQRVGPAEVITGKATLSGSVLDRIDELAARVARLEAARLIS